MTTLNAGLLPCCVWLVTLLVDCTAVTLSPCVSDGSQRVAEVKRGQTSRFRCQGLQAAHTVQWNYLPDSGGAALSAGVCYPLSDARGCVQTLSPTFTVSRPSDTESLMTVDTSQTQAQTVVSQGSLGCEKLTANAENDACQLDLITPAVVSTCSVRFEVQNNRDWMTAGSCTITSANSTRGRYHCQWYRQKETSSAEARGRTVGYTPRGGVCRFNEDMPIEEGSYSYSVTVTPGEVSAQASFTGSNQIRRPSAPTVTGCSPDGYIAENTAVSCTCRTDSVGQPAGRLLWYRDGVLVKTGNHGDSSLTLSQTLTRADHNTTQFRCDVNWAVNVTGQSRPFKVGYRPEKVSVRLGPSPGPEVSVEENSTVPVTCGADARPLATVTLVRQGGTQGGTQLDTGQSPLTFDLTASCTDSATYLCSAYNVIGQADTTASVRLYVKCTPRIPQTESALELNYQNQSVKRAFDVIAYPALNASFADFKYLGQDGTDSPSAISNIRLSTTCLPQSVNVYTSTCTLTVGDVTSPTAAGFYTVTLSNTEGSHDVRFRVLYNAPVSDPNTDEQSGNGAVIGGVIGGVVAIIAVGVIIVVVVVVLKRRRKAKGSQNTPGQTRYLEMEEAGGDQEAQGKPLSFAPTDVYAEVNKKAKKPKQTTEAEANGDPPADVYAQVDKTKNKTPAKKPPGEAKKNKKRKKEANEAAHVYGNVEDIKHDKGAKPKKPVPPAKEANSSGKTVNPDGLIYTTVDLSHKPKSGNTPPKKSEEDHVIYSEVKTS